MFFSAKDNFFSCIPVENYISSVAVFSVKRLLKFNGNLGNGVARFFLSERETVSVFFRHILQSSLQHVQDENLSFIASKYKLFIYLLYIFVTCPFTLIKESGINNLTIP